MSIETAKYEELRNVPTGAHVALPSGESGHVTAHGDTRVIIAMTVAGPKGNREIALDPNTTVAIRTDEAEDTTRGVNAIALEIQASADRLKTAIAKAGVSVKTAGEALVDATKAINIAISDAFKHPGKMTPEQREKLKTLMEGGDRASDS